MLCATGPSAHCSSPSPRDLPDVRDDERVHLSGVSLTESDMSAGGVADGYVSSDDLEDLVVDHLLSPAPRPRANVILHVVAPVPNTRPWPTLTPWHDRRSR